MSEPFPPKEIVFPFLDARSNEKELSFHNGRTYVMTDYNSEYGKKYYILYYIIYFHKYRYTCHLL